MNCKCLLHGKCSGRSSPTREDSLLGYCTRQFTPCSILQYHHLSNSCVDSYYCQTALLAASRDVGPNLLRQSGSTLVISHRLPAALLNHIATFGKLSLAHLIRALFPRN